MSEPVHNLPEDINSQSINDSSNTSSPITNDVENLQPLPITSNDVEPIDNATMTNSCVETPQVSNVPSPIEAISPRRSRRQTRRPGYLDAYEC